MIALTVVGVNFVINWPMTITLVLFLLVHSFALIRWSSKISIAVDYLEQFHKDHEMRIRSLEQGTGGRRAQRN